MDAKSEADNSEALDKGIRAGLVAYGVVHLIVAWTALQLVFGDGGGKASQTGAISQMAGGTFGKILLVLVSLGFVCLVLWQGVEAAVGHRDSDGGKRVFKRVASAGKAVLYAFLAYSAFSIVIGSGGSGGSGTDTWTAKLMRAPAGQVLVGLVGLGIVGVGLYQAYRGLAEKFTKRLDASATQGEKGKPIVLLGKVGYVAKGFALGTIGVLFLSAAITHEANKSGGLDQALHTLLEQPFGGPLLFVVALGLGCFGVYCFGWARHLDR